MHVSRKQAAGILGLLIAVVAVDQLVKGLVVRALADGGSRSLVPGLLDLSYRQNPGVAFSALPHAGPYLLIALNIVVLAMFVALTWRHMRGRRERIALALVCGGAIGNMLDRIRLHYVIDYLDFHVGRYHWPVFNIADASIVIGVGLLLLSFLAANHSPVPPPEGDRP